MQLEAKLEESAAQSAALRGELQSMKQAYGEKFEDFAVTIAKSNEVCASCIIPCTMLPKLLARDGVTFVCSWLRGCAPTICSGCQWS